MFTGFFCFSVNKKITEKTQNILSAIAEHSEFIICTLNKLIIEEWIMQKTCHLL